jgi:hypothetical protein
MQKALESPPTQLTVNQAAGIAVNACAAAAAVQPAKASHARYLVTSLPAARQPQTVSTTELGGQVGLPQAGPPSLWPLVLRLMPFWSGSPGFSNCNQDNAVRNFWKQNMQLLEQKQESRQGCKELMEANMQLLEQKQELNLIATDVTLTQVVELTD